MYKTNVANDERKDSSVGEDLETFIENMRNEKLKKSATSLKGETGKRPKLSITPGELKKSFFLCLLDKEERRKLEMKDWAFKESFENATNSDVPQAEWEASESNLKFGIICNMKINVRDKFKLWSISQFVASCGF